MIQQRSLSFELAGALAYSLILVHGTLYPFTGWALPADSEWLDVLPRWYTRISRMDLLTNLLVYVPLGGLAVWGLRRRLRFGAAILIATMFGTILSLTLELLQGLIRTRTASLNDLAANAFGCLAGAVAAALLSPWVGPRTRVSQIRERWLRKGVEANLGLAVVALWALSQVSPFVPSLDVGDLRSGLRPLWTTLYELGTFDLHQSSAYVLAICGLGLLCSLFVKADRPLVRVFSLFTLGILFFKVPVETRQLSLEALVGTLVGLVFFAVIRRRPPRSLPLLAACLILSFVVVDGLRTSLHADPIGLVKDFNWVPFGKYRLNLYDVADILGSVWPYLGIAYSVRRSSLHAPAMLVALAGTTIVGAVAFAIEWGQRWLLGRSPDLTDCLIAIVAWWVPWLRSAGRRRL